MGAGPVGLFLAALLQSVDGYAVRLYERRPEYTRTRMVSLAPYLIADSVESYEADMLDWQNVEAIFEPTELKTRMAYRRSVAADLRGLLLAWTRGFIPLKMIEGSLSELIEARNTGTVERIAGEVSAEQALAMVEAGDILVDCTGTRSVLRDLLVPGDDLEGKRTEHDGRPARVRVGGHIPVRPTLRLQRVLQVPQERREPQIQVHPGGELHLL